MFSIRNASLVATFAFGLMGCATQGLNQPQTAETGGALAGATASASAANYDPSTRYEPSPNYRQAPRPAAMVGSNGGFSAVSPVACVDEPPSAAAAIPNRPLCP